MVLFKKSFLLFIPFSSTILFSSCLAQSKANEEQVVGETLKAIGYCYHWAGEVGDQSEERNKDITEGINHDCPIAQQKAENAYKLYPKNASLAARILQLIDIGYFKVHDDEKTNVCETAFTQFEGDYLGSKEEDVLFRAICPGQAKRLYGK